MTRSETIYDIMNPTNTIGLNRFLAHAIGRDAAIIYSALLSKSKYYLGRGTTEDGWFYSTAADLEESTAIPLYHQRSAIKTLVKHGLILCERKGLPAKRSFYIVEDTEVLKCILAEGEQTAKKINPIVYTAKEEKTISESEIVACNELHPQSNNISTKGCNNCKDNENQDIQNINIKESELLTTNRQKNSQHSYNPKGNNLKLNSINQPQTKKGKMDRIDNSENRELYLEIIKENVGYDALCDTNAHNKDNIDEIVSLITDVVCTSSETIRIGKENKPAETVRSVFLKLTDSHIQYVIDCMKETTSRIRNIKNYLLTALYNAKFTINNYYQALVNHDLYGATS